jgi:putative DNA primase/helicase
MGYELNHRGNAEILELMHKGKLRFDCILGRWIYWNEANKRWVVDDTNYMLNLASSAVDYREINFNNKTTVEATWIRKSKDYSNLNQTLKVAQSLPKIIWTKQWDTDPWILHTPNGIVTLKDGAFREATPEDAVLKVTGVDYDKEALCPKWLKFLDEIFNTDKDLISYVQSAVGYSLAGSVKEQSLFACHGSGANGKSTFLGVISYVMGEYASELRAATLESYGRNLAGEGVELPGARFAKCEEVGEGEALDSGRIKSWTGENEMVVRPLYHSAIHFPPTHKLWLTFNTFPEIDDESDAIWRRIKLIPFEVQFIADKINKNLPGELREEGSGILNWAIEGCLAWQKEGLKIPPKAEQDQKDLRVTSDTIKAFSDECLVRQADAQVTTQRLYQAYENWCKRNGDKAEKKNAMIYRLKQQMGVTSARIGHNGTRGWQGIGLAADAPLSADTSKNGVLEVSATR